MASVIPIYKKTVTVEKEFNKDKPKQELKQTQRSEAEPPQATSAPNELALECRNDRGKIVKPLTITKETAPEVVKRNESDSQNKATSVRSFVKKCRSSSAITSRFIFPSATLRVNANHRCVQGTGSYDRIYQNFSKHQFSSIKHKRLKAFRQRTPSTDDYRKRSLNISNVFQIEACTMKPSCYTNESCQTQNLMSLPAGKFDTSSTCILSPALSLTEICSGRDKSDLKTVYFMLSAIEGRIRRLKRNVRSQ
ncbi:unnamed protein product, partial [Iphiclides podalirius]